MVRPDLQIEQHAQSKWTLPRETQSVITKVRVPDRHPGIQLDRLSIPGDQIAQKLALDSVTKCVGDPAVLTEVRTRRQDLLRVMSRSTLREWTLVTAGPLTLHLSRANALENAGLALHPVYGFAYLPASGLKGMARAAASSLGFDQIRISEIFGNESGEAREEMQRSGQVCFHDAWPVQWPKLMVDIVNNHHPDYYSGTDAPGDWESPNPVYFLAVKPKTEFQFALTARRSDIPASVMNDAEACLKHALTNFGAGAKTAAGYGWFDIGPSTTTMDVATTSQSMQWNVTLDTPAFLAGADQEREDTDLRSATIRGQLRAWWRTLHAGYLTRDEMRWLEAAVWGSTTNGSPIRLHLKQIKSPTVNQHFHPTERGSGLRYMAYGMDENSHGVRKQRLIAETDGQWKLTVGCRASRFQSDPKLEGVSISEEMVKEQLLSALWLFNQFGSVGSKGRKGFGSIRLTGASSIQSLEQTKNLASQLRKSLGLGDVFATAKVESAALSHEGTRAGHYKFTARNPREAIELVGKAYLGVALSRGYKHNPDKASLGLPRKIHGPRNDPLPHQDAANHQRPEFLDTRRRRQRRVEDARYSSPIHLHLEDMRNGQWSIRWIAFPAVDLPTLDASAGFLDRFLADFQTQLSMAGPIRAADHRNPSASQNSPSIQGFEATTVKIVSIIQAGNRLQYKVQEAGRPKTGMLVDGTPPDTPPAVDDEVHVYRITTSDPNSPRYRWTLPESPKPNDKKRDQGRGNRR